MTEADQTISCLQCRGAYIRLAGAPGGGMFRLLKRVLLAWRHFHLRRGAPESDFGAGQLKA